MKNDNIAPVKASSWRFNIHDSWEKRGFELRAVCQNGTITAAVQTITMLTIEPNESVPVAGLFAPEDLQVLMNEMWRIGIRPSCGEGHIGEINATRSHLEDMRKIVFNALKIEGVK